MDFRFLFIEGFLMNTIIFIIIAAIVRLIRETGPDFKIYRWQKLLAFTLLFVPFSYLVAVFMFGAGYGVQQLAKTVWEFFVT